MTRANNARRSGDEFQARLFWLEAIKLLDSHSSVSEVAWESGPPGLDDIRIVYDPPKATPIGRVHTEYIQCKRHVRSDEFGFEDLTDPRFIWVEPQHRRLRSQGHGSAGGRVGFDIGHPSVSTDWRATSNCVARASSSRRRRSRHSRARCGRG
jgi:hypothetical protein